MITHGYIALNNVACEVDTAVTSRLTYGSSDLFPKRHRAFAALAGFGSERTSQNCRIIVAVVPWNSSRLRSGRGAESAETLDLGNDPECTFEEPDPLASCPSLRHHRWSLNHMIVEML